MGIDFIFDVNSSILNSHNSLMISSVSSFLTCGTNNLNETQIHSTIDSLGGYLSNTYNKNSPK